VAFRDGDLAGVFDTGVEFIHAGTVTKALVDMPDAVLLDARGLGGLIGKSVMATVRTSEISDLKVGDTVKVDGTDYTVASRTALDDRALTLLLCSLD